MNIIHGITVVFCTIRSKAYGVKEIIEFVTSSKLRGAVVQC